MFVFPQTSSSPGPSINAFGCLPKYSFASFVVAVVSGFILVVFIFGFAFVTIILCLNFGDLLVRTVSFDFVNGYTGSG